MSKHVADQRKDAARQKIEKKIEVLERYAAAETIPEDVYLPKDLAAFRAWVDKDLGLGKIGSPNTMDRSYNRGLKKRALELIEQLAKRKARKERRGKIIDTLRAQSKTSGRLTRELTNQLHATRHELSQSQQNEARMEAKLSEMMRENGELRQRLKTISGLRPADTPAGGGHHGVQ